MSAALDALDALIRREANSALGGGKGAEAGAAIYLSALVEARREVRTAELRELEGSRFVAKESDVRIIRSGPRTERLSYSWGCRCGARWNSNRPDMPTGALCSPTCRPELTPIEET